MTQQLGGYNISEHDVEQEFWRLVESQTETVEVEYGADVHVAIHGRLVVVINSRSLAVESTRLTGRFASISAVLLPRMRPILATLTRSTNGT